MKRFLFLALLFCGVSVYGETFSPKASDEAVIIQGKARFTVLTDRLIRMEWAEDGVFEDNATLGIVNRELPVPQFKVKQARNLLTINTGKVTLKYVGREKFDEKNLSVTFVQNGAKRSWHPGMPDDGNLLGTARTLDRFKGDETIDPYDKGVCSRDGWALIDESARHLLTPVDADWKYWVAERPAGERTDWYLFAYGHDYTAAVSDFTKVAGNIPLPPKYAFGYWWCRYWLYSDSEIRDLVSHFHDYSIPLDVFIIDMDWHKTWGATGKKGEKDASGERLGWTGYTWDEVLFPNPAGLLKELRAQNIQTSLNLHPASGLQTQEEPYERFVKDYLSRTGDYDGPKDYKDADGRPVYVPFRMSQMAWADAYFNSVIRPMENDGVSFWWLDWQQFLTSRYVKKLSNTFWLNYTFWNDMARQSESAGTKARRPMIYHRWGGIGSHRYQVGFSGDTYATWKVLGALPYFTYTASNVGYCYWGHDIGGHMQPKGVKTTDPELYTRWMQSGVFTPIYKSHSTKDMTMEKRFWVFPNHFDAMRAAIRLRYDLSPYIYNAAREAYETGIGLCRPLYYTYPENERAYSEKQEFMFGPDILATTVCAPMDSVTALSPRTMWFPEDSDWYDMATGVVYKGGTTAELKYTLDENPWFVRTGAVIPLAGKNISSLQEQSGELRFRIVPGTSGFKGSVYEDDGCSQAYSTDSFARTAFSKHVIDNEISFVVEARKGSFEGALPTRRITLEIEGASAPASVTLNGAAVPWHYDGDNLTIVVEAPELPVNETLEFKVDADFCFTNGEKALLKRMHALSEEGKMEYAAAVGARVVPFEFLKFSQAGSIISAKPQKAAEILKALNPEALKKELDSSEKMSSAFKAKVFAQAGIYFK